MSQQQPFDAGIPILTEVIDILPAAPSYAQPWQHVAGHAQPSQDLPVLTVTLGPAVAPAPPASAMSEAEWAVLESRLSTRIVQQLQSTIEQRIEDSLAPLLGQVREQLAAQLTAQITTHIITQVAAQLGGELSAQLGRQLGDTLRTGLQDTVERAVAQEITHLQAQKK